jgi:hypothetical protein
MSYATINKCANDESLQKRVTSAAAAEQSANPEGTMFALMWPISTAADVEAAYASALAAENPDPGGDESVITDGMILGLVQMHWPPNTPMRGQAPA